MANYVKSTNFTSKDALVSGNPLKIIKGAEFDVEFNALATAVASKADATGGNASGTWPISITGTAANATNAVSAATATKIAGANWVFEQVGTELVASYGGTRRFKVDSLGNAVFAGDVTSFGTV